MNTSVWEQLPLGKDWSKLRVKRPGGLDLDFALSRFVSHTLCEQFGPQNH